MLASGSGLVRVMRASTQFQSAQQQLREKRLRNVDSVSTSERPLRIRTNVGFIIHHEMDNLGDGVVVAARVKALAEAGDDGHNQHSGTPGPGSWARATKGG